MSKTKLYNENDGISLSLSVYLTEKGICLNGASRPVYLRWREMMRKFQIAGLFVLAYCLLAMPASVCAQQARPGNGQGREESICAKGRASDETGNGPGSRRQRYLRHRSRGRPLYLHLERGESLPDGPRPDGRHDLHSTRRRHQGGRPDTASAQGTSSGKAEGIRRHSRCHRHRHGSQQL